MVVGLEADANWERVADQLRAHGARTVNAPVPSLPDVVVADFAPCPADELAAEIIRMTGVRYAEPDVMQDGF